jgi:serine/threonine-protein kinase
VDDSQRPRARENLGDLAAKAHAAALLGTVISGRYRVVELLAMGGVGAVYLGEHLRMHKHVAIKVLHPDSQSLPDLPARFEREAVAGAHIQHANVAAATDFGELEDGAFFLVLEYVRGATLREVIRRGPVPVGRAVGIMKQLAAALGATHAMNIVHRDVKPRNVMLIEGERDVVKLIDFGLAKLDLKQVSTVAAGRASISDHLITGTGVVFGTFAYLAPEGSAGIETVDARADLYAAGLVFYEMLSGKHPFDTTDPVELIRRHHKVQPPPIAQRAPGVAVPPAVEAVVMRLLEKKPEARYQTAEALLAALEAAWDGGSITPTPSPVSLTEPVFPGPSLMPPPMATSAPPAATPIAAAATPIAATAPATATPIAAPAPALSVPPPSGSSAQAAIQTIRPPAPATRARWPYAAGLAGLAALSVGAIAVWLPSREPGPSVPATGSAAPAVSVAASSAPSVATVVAAVAPVPAAASAAASVDTAPAKAFDGTIPRAVLRRSGGRDRVRGLEAFYTLAEHDPAAFHDPTLLVPTRELAAAVAVGGGADTDRLFDLLGHRLGADGLDVLYEIVRTRGGSRAAARAEPLLREGDAMSRATPALRITFALREAPCPEKAALLDRAVAEGDLRTLTVMETTGVSCLGPGSEPLKAAIKALRLRLR